jgi:hypothetical protein
MAARVDVARGVILYRQDVLKPFEEVAVAFAAALVARDFSGAHEILAPALRAQLSESNLEEELVNMYRRYAQSEPSRCQFVPDGSLETWPQKQPGDLGKAYVSIEGDDFNEAIYVLVSDVEGVPLIREISWGRP